ncbi:MAG TPA: aminoglycoside phosphotransferase family protein [Nocardioidaceae bacterium]|nr:aminoglycoside phosphotransferase family protein [Nocardioidaceae bacterium]
MTRSTNYRISDAQLALLGPPLDTLSGNGHRVQVAEAVTIRRDVYRLALDGARYPSVVVKRVPSLRSQLEHRVIDRWLPAVGLDGFGPPRLVAVGEPDGRHTWHVYDDLGPHGLDRNDVDEDSIVAAMDKVAELHAEFARHAMMPEPRYAAFDMGVHYYVKSVRDALRSVQLLRPPVVPMSDEDEALRDRLLDLLTGLVDDEANRLRLLHHQAGPETLVHGDLTRANVFVMSENGRRRVRLIDWDRCGVAPAGFDISTHLAYYEEPERRVVHESYSAAMAARGFAFPSDLDWDLLVSTFEAGRLANQIIWVALGIQEGNGWTFAELSAWLGKLAAVVDGTPRGLARGPV